MSRIFNVRSSYGRRVAIQFQDFRLLHCCINSRKFFPGVRKCVRYSVLQNMCSIFKSTVTLESTVLGKRNVNKLNAKHEELIKILEARTCALGDKQQVKCNEVYKSDSHSTMSFADTKNKVIDSNNNKNTLANKLSNQSETTDSYVNEGILTVKCSSQNATSFADSKSIVIDSSSNKDILANKSSEESKTTDYYEDGGIFSVKNIPRNKKKKSDQPHKENALKKEYKKNKAPLSEKQEEIKHSTKYLYAVHALKPYIEVNINANEMERAQTYLKMQLELLQRKHKMENLNSVELYNLLISGWASKGKVDKIKQIFSCMEEQQLTPNLQSFAGYLEGISRSNFIDVPEIQHVVNEMRKKGLNPEDVFEKCLFKNDQREKVTEVLGFVGISSTVKPFEENVPYTCNLLLDLNDSSFGRGERFPNFGFQEQDIDNLTSSQLETESAYSLRIKSVAAMKEPDNSTLKARKLLEAYENLWRTKLTAAINRLKKFEKRYHFGGFHKEESIYPYISVIDTDILINLLLQQVKIMAETGEFFRPSEKVIYKSIGIQVMNHYFIWLNKKSKITDKVLSIHKEFLRYLLNPKLLSQYSPSQYWEHLKRQNPSGPTIDVSNSPWPYGALIKIGSELYDILAKNIAMDSNLLDKKKHNKKNTPSYIPVFFQSYGSLDGVKLLRCIGTSQSICKLYRDARLDYLEFDATLVPMECPPKPWVKQDSGGLLVTRTSLIRLSDHAIHQTTYYSNTPSKQLNPCFDSLNSLSLCPWIINKPLLDLVINVFQKGGNEELDIPLNPDSFIPPKICASMTDKEKHAIKKQRLQLKKKKCEASSLWFDCLYKLSIANHFRDKTFWLPHNLDFRGRTYPTPPHFNHLGSDMARSILLFAEGQPLGKNGLNWLKIHLVNLTGFKKRDSHSERLQFADEMIPNILDSADYPFEGKQWWKTSDKPWQTLACCKELANALRHPNPEEYVSHFPVHQDGSCNGLQHYAALGRDHLGAIEVNLHPDVAPHDVYSSVSALVERERQKDAAEGVEVAQALEGFIRRKVVKQTVMTFVYGVTRFGAKEQILRQLKDIPEFPEKYYHEGAIYIMKKIFFSIKEMFTATQEIQDWLTDCAEHITKVSGDTLEWITPLGLPVVQPYHKEISIKSNKYPIPGKEAFQTYTSYYEPYQLPNVRKQKNGFAPNFIHSLDASHMMLTSLFCQRKGITFVSVHDCYWTHASTVEIMNKICREQFVSLHKQPILEDLSSFFLDKYARVVDEHIKGKKTKKAANIKLRDVLSSVPKKGTFDLDKVLESEYFFS